MPSSIASCANGESKLMPLQPLPSRCWGTPKMKASCSSRYSTIAPRIVVMSEAGMFRRGFCASPESSTMLRKPV